MKKLPVNRNYLTVSIYAFLVIVASAACILCMTHYPAVHSTVKGALSESVYLRRMSGLYSESGLKNL